MGSKSIWNGRQLPCVGDEVLIELGSKKSWEKYTVTGFKIWPPLDGVSDSYHRIFVNVARMDDVKGGARTRVTNSRLLKDIRPIDWKVGEPYNPADEEPSK